MNSCLYRGTVEHWRRTPVEHRFRYRLWMAYLDLAELPELVGPRRLIAAHRFAAASFLRGDHFGDPSQSLDESARLEVKRQTGIRPTGSIRLLTLLRQWGYYFSPLNVLYCFDEAGENVEFVVAEVSNTPWLEKHVYVLWDGNRSRVRSQGSGVTGCDDGPRSSDSCLLTPDSLNFRHPKQFHVSPFMGMDATYQWSMHSPGDRLLLTVSSSVVKEELFHAGLAFERQPLTRANLRRSLLVNPSMPAKVVAAIYYQAFRLWMKRCPYFPHPKHVANTPVA